MNQGLPSARETQKLCERLDRPTDRKELAGLIANLNQLVFSAAGKLISTDLERGGGFDLGGDRRWADHLLFDE